VVRVSTDIRPDAGTDAARVVGNGVGDCGKTVDVRVVQRERVGRRTCPGYLLEPLWGVCVRACAVTTPVDLPFPLPAEVSILVVRVSTDIRPDAGTDASRVVAVVGRLGMTVDARAHPLQRESR